MVRRIIYILLFTSVIYGQTTNRIVYEGWLDSLVMESPLIDSLIKIVEDNAPGTAADTVHYHPISRIFFLQDSLDGKLNRSEYSPSGFDTTYIYAVTDSLAEDIAEVNGKFLENIVEDLTPQLGADLDLNTHNLTNITGVAFDVSPTEMSYLDGTTSDIQTQFNTLDNYIDSNYVLFSETTAWDKTASDDLLKSEFDDSVANYISDDAYNEATWDANTDVPTKNAVYDKIESLSPSYSARGHIWGLVLSNNAGDVLHDIDIAVGEATNETTYDNIVLTGALTKQLDAAWAVGTNQGGLNTGTIAGDTWYEVHLIKRVDTGVVDVMFTTTANRSVLPDDYKIQRRIGWIYSGNKEIKEFSQRGNYFTWITQVNDVASNKSTSATAAILSAPPYCIARFRATADMSTSVNANAVIVFLEVIEGAVTPATTTGIGSLGYWDLSTGISAGHFELRVSSTSTIQWDCSVAVGAFDISTWGFIDEREQYGNY